MNTENKSTIQLERKGKTFKFKRKFKNENDMRNCG